MVRYPARTLEATFSRAHVGFVCLGAATARRLPWSSGIVQPFGGGPPFWILGGTVRSPRIDAVFSEVAARPHQLWIGAV